MGKAPLLSGEPMHVLEETADPDIAHTVNFLMEIELGERKFMFYSLCSISHYKTGARAQRLD